MELTSDGVPSVGEGVGCNRGRKRDERGQAVPFYRLVGLKRSRVVTDGREVEGKQAARGLCSSMHARGRGGTAMASGGRILALTSGPG